jgi:hypothetical protein
VVLTDIRMPPTSVAEGIDIAERLRRKHPGLGTLTILRVRVSKRALALGAKLIIDSCPGGSTGVRCTFHPIPLYWTR